MSAYSDRRFKVVGFDQQLLVQIFNWWANPPHWLCLPIMDELPNDCRVVAVHGNFAAGCIDAILCSKEFAPVPPGHEPPRIDKLQTTFKTVKFQDLVQPKENQCGHRDDR